jgi:catechol 2,3-dioxygenase-like lactoylglutathione lyase family enzyme
MLTESNREIAMAKNLSIGIVMLGVKDLERSLAFYCDKLGLTVKFQTPGFAFLDGGGVTIALSEPLGKATEQLTGATELVFTVGNVMAGYEQLNERGIEFAQKPRPVTPNDWAANFNDPDGHRLSIFGPERG